MSKKQNTVPSTPVSNEKKGRVEYTHTAPLTATPLDYSFEKHVALRRADFAHDLAFMQFKAAQAQFNVARFNEKIGEAKALGGVASGKARRAVKRIKRLTKRLVEQIDELVKEGVDEGAVMINVIAKDESIVALLKRKDDAEKAAAEKAAKEAKAGAKK